MRKGNFVSGLVVGIPTASVTSVVLGILGDHLAWNVAIGIAIVPGVLVGWAA